MSIARSHAIAFRSRLGVEVDLHRRRIGTTVDETKAWPALSSRNQTLKIDSIGIQIPDLASTLTIVALHAAHDGCGMPKADV